MDLGMGEILLVLLFALLVYGGRLPEVARSLGRAISTVKRNLQESTTEVTRGIASAADGIDEAERPRTVRRAPPPAADAAAEVPTSSGAAVAAPPEPGAPPAEPPRPPAA